MSVEITKTVLADFLTNCDKNVLALTGAWGSGKTHAWDEALKQHQAKIKFKTYCYVSLFGINTMPELRMALFLKSRPVTSLNLKYDFDTVNKNWAAMLTTFVKREFGRFSDFLRSLPYGSSVSLGLEALAPITVRESLICFDDFERQTSIKPEDILGFITELREERDCKIALIFNAEELREKGSYRAYREKAIDLEVHYAPTVKEAFDLVFESSFPCSEIVLQHVADLQITNVRILRRLKNLLIQIASATSNLHPEVYKSAIQSTVLLCWCAYASDPSKPKLEDIQNWNDYLLSTNKKTDEEPASLLWKKRLQAYGFIHVDDYDIAIAKIVERGYVEGSGFVELSIEKDRELQSADICSSFHQAWRNFHEDFSIDQSVFISEFYDAACKAIGHIGRNDLNSSVTLLRQLERNDLADDLIQKYILENKDKPELFSTKNRSFIDGNDDDKLLKEFSAVYSQFEVLPTLEEAIVFMVRNSGYNSEHLEAMERASTDDYYNLFMKKHTDVRFSDLAKWTLRWSGTQHEQITAKAREALERVKGVNLLNKLRVMRIGV